MGELLSRRLVTDRFWALAEPLIPEFAPRRQGGGTTPLDSRDVFTAVVFVLTSECAWRRLPPTFAVSPATAHRRFTAWTAAGLWEEMRQAVLVDGGLDGDREWVAAVIDSAISR
ncbi:transposase [Streptomyces zagrosensis]|uniref:Transposase n=1 Tax=Streptomyces zagrosensis TaxID=1042984 RepID=A0A7W9QAK7_9ACTN|nr:transposase [Streptomyces zagrosensis]MBB5936238.1 transposase [Streptomyces zagrosensis]